MTLKYTVNLSEIREIWESWNGWYWFVTEYHEGSLAFGLVKGWDIEWGYFDLNELRELKKTLRVWKVPRKNWAVCPCVESDADSCSKGTGAGVPAIDRENGAPVREKPERRCLEKWKTKRTTKTVLPYVRQKPDVDTRWWWMGSGSTHQRQVFWIW
jgi:hypothetical protein